MTVLFAAGTFMHYVFGIAMFLVSVFLILLVLVQRGRGGGLTGALGGMGGQSAFGAKAGDVFTRVTMVTAGIWIALCMGSIWVLNAQEEWGSSGPSKPGFSSPDSDDDSDDDSDASPVGGAPDADGEGGLGTVDDGGSLGAVDADAGGEDTPGDTDSTSGDGGAAETPAADAEAGDSSTEEPESGS